MPAAAELEVFSSLESTLVFALGIEDLQPGDEVPHCSRTLLAADRITQSMRRRFWLIWYPIYRVVLPLMALRRFEVF